MNQESSSIPERLEGERQFREVAAAWGDLQRFAELNQKYNLEMDFDSVSWLCERFDLSFPPL